jgi:formate/nitrite transporter FocA (FNT family)
MAASKTAAEILESVVEDGRKELERGSTGLAFSGFAAGLNISFSAVALAVVASVTGGLGVLAYAAYPIGFMIVILGRAQLFTENTVTPVTVVLSQKSRLPNMLRMWAVVFASNILGAMAFAVALVYGKVLDPSAFAIVFEEAASKLDYTFMTTVVKGVFGGWLVALVAWLVAASRDTISQVIFVYLLIALIPAAGLTHCIAGSAEVLMSVFAGHTSWAEYFGGFLLPVTIGNTVGGVVLVTLLNFGQVIGSEFRPMKDSESSKTE